MSPQLPPFHPISPRSPAFPSTAFGVAHACHVRVSMALTQPRGVLTAHSVRNDPADRREVSSEGAGAPVVTEHILACSSGADLSLLPMDLSPVPKGAALQSSEGGDLAPALDVDRHSLVLDRIFPPVLAAHNKVGSNPPAVIGETQAQAQAQAQAPFPPYPPISPHFPQLW